MLTAVLVRDFEQIYNAIVALTIQLLEMLILQTE